MFTLLLLTSLVCAFETSKFNKMIGKSIDAIKIKDHFFKSKIRQSLADIDHSKHNNKISYKVTKQTIHKEASKNIKKYILEMTSLGTTSNLVDITTHARKTEKELLKDMKHLKKEFDLSCKIADVQVQNISTTVQDQIDNTLKNITTMKDNLMKDVHSNNLTKNQFDLRSSLAVAKSNNMKEHLFNTTTKSFNDIDAAMISLRKAEKNMLQSYNNVFVILKRKFSKILFISQTHTPQNTTTSDLINATSCKSTNVTNTNTTVTNSTNATTTQEIPRKVGLRKIKSNKKILKKEKAKKKIVSRKSS